MMQTICRAFRWPFDAGLKSHLMCHTRTHSCKNVSSLVCSAFPFVCHCNSFALSLRFGGLRVQMWNAADYMPHIIQVTIQCKHQTGQSSSLSSSAAAEILRGEILRGGALSENNPQRKSMNTPYASPLELRKYLGGDIGGPKFNRYKMGEPKPLAKRPLKRVQNLQPLKNQRPLWNQEHRTTFDTPNT